LIRSGTENPTSSSLSPFASRALILLPSHAKCSVAEIASFFCFFFCFALACA
jgi:hypothetical protein